MESIFVVEVLVKCKEASLYDVILGNIKSAVLPDTLPFNKSQLHVNARLKTEQRQRKNCGNDNRNNAA